MFNQSNSSLNVTGLGLASMHYRLPAIIYKLILIEQHAPKSVISKQVERSPTRYLVQDVERVHEHNNVHFLKAKKLGNPSHTSCALFRVASPSEGILDQQVFSVGNSRREDCVEDGCEASKE